MRFVVVRPLQIEHCIGSAMRSTLLACAMIGLIASPIHAEEIQTTKQDWDQLPKKQQDHILVILKQNGILDQDDVVIYSGPKQNKMTEKDLSPAAVGALIPGFCKLFAASKSALEVGKCADNTNCQRASSAANAKRAATCAKM
jgi:hypothetical protein